MAATATSQDSKSLAAAAEAPQSSKLGVDPEEVGLIFVKEYYTFVNKKPEVLHRFYSTNSILLRGDEGEAVKACEGMEAIRVKIAAQEFDDCKVLVTQVDSHSSANDGILIQVLGEMCNGNGPSQKFVQTFFLAPQEAGYYVLNDIFRFLKDEVDIDYDGDDDVEDEAKPEDLEEEAPAHEAASEPSVPLPETEAATQVSVPEPTVVEKNVDEPAATPAVKTNGVTSKQAPVIVEEPDKSEKSQANAKPHTWAALAASKEQSTTPPQAPQQLPQQPQKSPQASQNKQQQQPHQQQSQQQHQPQPPHQQQQPRHHHSQSPQQQQPRQQQPQKQQQQQKHFQQPMRQYRDNAIHVKDVEKSTKKDLERLFGDEKFFGGEYVNELVDVDLKKNTAMDPKKNTATIIFKNDIPAHIFERLDRTRAVFSSDKKVIETVTLARAYDHSKRNLNNNKRGGGGGGYRQK